ncbi:hypothetical protein Mbo2_064 [Rhodococcus phage Mbo2]|uniref:Uncharacterized protein n=1 Tax=Rhodococcus phage Mbo2 TaxID=2936911 RepID=A0A9E7IEF9_9CAUD|nr:hypothetical protein Mbo2_064 [Rhodococcus phage Mbo2]
MIRVPIQVNDRTLYTVDIVRAKGFSTANANGNSSNLEMRPNTISDYRWRVFIGVPKPEYQSLVEAGWVTHRYGDGAVALVAKVMDMIDEKMILDVIAKEKGTA